MRDVRLDSCELKAIMDRAAKLGKARLRCALQPGAQARTRFHRGTVFPTRGIY
jgi:hypothetical protein